MKRILALLGGFAVGLGLCMQPVEADEGCRTGLTGRATLISTAYPGAYVTCARSCSGITWHKSAAHFNPNGLSVVIDYVYKIQGGGIAGLPACRPEIQDNAGWVFDG